MESRDAPRRHGGCLPNSNIELGFEYMFSDEKMKSWDRTTISGGFDSSMSLSLPNKVAKAGKSLSKTRARRDAFRAEEVRRAADVLSLWFDYAAWRRRSASNRTT